MKSKAPNQGVQLLCEGASMNSGLVANRECGECTACCVNLRIDEPGLQKKAGIPCPNMTPKGGCKIYSERPSVCRTWHCAWRYMSQLGEEWRPDN
jgi:hypothetical protein